MKTLGHLSSYPVTLEVLSPLFIGSGEQVSKKEYLYLAGEGKIIMINLHKLADYLSKKKLMERYQTFMLDSSSRNIDNFFRENRIGPQEYRYFADYQIDGAGEAIDRNNLRDVKLFIKDSQGKPYIPGSSLKGALRTAILTQMLLEDGRVDRTTLAAQWQNALQGCRDQNAVKRQMIAQTVQWESALLNTLPLANGLHDAVNSVMRGIAVSDSAPLSTDQLMLAQKIDRSTAAKDQLLPISRECLRPGSKGQLTITIDERMAHESGWTMPAILEAVRSHQMWQQEVFYKHFQGHEKQASTGESTILMLGGGVGFANKSINSAAIGEQAALQLNAQILEKLFPSKGNHDKDTAIGVSPHMQKMAKYQGHFYRMGQCRLEVQ